MSGRTNFVHKLIIFCEIFHNWVIWEIAVILLFFFCVAVISVVDDNVFGIFIGFLVGKKYMYLLEYVYRDFIWVKKLILT